MNDTIDKSKRRRPREVKYYPSVEACTQAKLEDAMKFLEGMDLSPILGPGYECMTFKNLPHSPSSPAERESAPPSQTPAS
jgi:hypothetical protein